MNNLTLKFKLRKNKGNYPSAEKDVTYHLYADVPELLDENDPDILVTIDRSKIAKNINIKKFKVLAEGKLNVSDNQDMGYGENGRYIEDRETGIKIAEYRWTNIYLCLHIQMYSNKLSEQEIKERLDAKQNDYRKTFLKLYDVIGSYMASERKPLNDESILSCDEIEQILNFQGYFKKSEIEFGIHGPELKENRLYISLYHFCEYKGINPHDYNLYELGNYLSSLISDYIECKYLNQSYYIKKYNYEFIKLDYLSMFKSK